MSLKKLFKRFKTLFQSELSPEDQFRLDLYESFDEVIKTELKLKTRPKEFKSTKLEEDS